MDAATRACWKIEFRRSSARKSFFLEPAARNPLFCEMSPSGQERTGLIVLIPFWKRNSPFRPPLGSTQLTPQLHELHSPRCPFADFPSTAGRKEVESIWY